MEFILLTHFKWDVYSTLSHDLGMIFNTYAFTQKMWFCAWVNFEIKKVSPLLFIFNLSAEIKNQAAGKIRCFFDCLLTGESSWRHHYVILRNFLESEFLIYSKRIQAIAVTSYVLTKFCFSSDAGLPDYAKRAPKFRIKVRFIKLSAWNRGLMFPAKSGRSLIHFGRPWAHFRIGCLILISE